MPCLPPAIEKIYELHNKNNSQPKYAELVDTFSAIIQQFDSVFLILDALDECSPDQRQVLCEFALDLTKPNVMPTASQAIGTTLTNPSHRTTKSRGILKLFITSRQRYNLKPAFLKNSIQKIKVGGAKVDKDIEDYIKAQIQERLQGGDLVLENMALKETILAVLTAKAGGMYVPFLI